MDIWTEKYRPKTLNDIVGNFNAIKEIKRWAEHWKKDKPKKKAVIFHGKPGTGKTSSAIALGLEYNWPIIELNASDVRNATNIKKIATIGSLNETFDEKGKYYSSNKGGKKLIILDEADNLYERSSSKNDNEYSDKGGKKAIVDTIKFTQQPIILIVNDYYNLIKGSGEELKSITKLIRFYTPRTEQISDLLKKICFKEDIKIDIDVLDKISARCNGDIRSAINDLQSISLNKTKISIDTLNTIGYRDQNKIIFEFLKEIFKTSDIKKIRQNSLNIDEDPQNILLWINENLPSEYKDFNDLVEAYENLTKADIYFKRCTRRQNYGLWAYACDLMNGGVAVSKTHNYSNERYNFPSWLQKSKKLKPNRDIRKIIIKKIGNNVHASNRKIEDYFQNFFLKKIRNDNDFAINMIKKLELSESEIKYLFNKKYSEIINKKHKPDKEFSKNINTLNSKKETERIQQKLF